MTILMSRGRVRNVGDRRFVVGLCIFSNAIERFGLPSIECPLLARRIAVPLTLTHFSPLEYLRIRWLYRGPLDFGLLILMRTW